MGFHKKFQKQLKEPKRLRRLQSTMQIIPYNCSLLHTSYLVSKRQIIGRKSSPQKEKRHQQQAAHKVYFIVVRERQNLISLSSGDLQNSQTDRQRGILSDSLLLAFSLIISSNPLHMGSPPQQMQELESSSPTSLTATAAPCTSPQLKRKETLNSSTCILYS